MKVDVFAAPLSEDGREILKDRNAARELIFKLLTEDHRGHFEVRAGERTFDVSSTASVDAATRSR